VVLKFNAHLVKCRLKHGLCNPPSIICHPFVCCVGQYVMLMAECETPKY